MPGRDVVLISVTDDLLTNKNLTLIVGFSHTCANHTVLLRAPLVWSGTSWFLCSAHSSMKAVGGLQSIASHGVSYIKHETDIPALLLGPHSPDMSVWVSIASCLPGLDLSPKRFWAWILAAQQLLFSWIITELSRLFWDLSTPFTSSGSIGRCNSGSKSCLLCSCLPQILRPSRKTLTPTWNSPVPPCWYCNSHHHPYTCHLQLLQCFPSSTDHIW